MTEETKTTGSKPITEYAHAIHLCLKLIKCGARPVAASNLTRIPRPQVIRMYKEARDKTPPRGMLPSSPDWFVAVEPRRREASEFLKICRQLRKFYDNDSECLVEAYKIYSANHPSPRLDINRAWTLWRHALVGMIEERVCNACCQVYITHADEPDIYRKCLVCGGNDSTKIHSAA